MYDPEEQEQIDAFKAWWKQYGNLVIAAVVAAAITAAAVALWQNYKNDKAEKASQLYTQLEKAARSADHKQVKELSTQLMEQYGSSVYGPMAALVVAKGSFESGDMKGAATQLQWAVDHTKSEEMRATARLRLAGVLLDERKYDEAAKQLDNPHPESFVPLYSDLRGDVLVAQGKSAEAKAAYQQALSKLPEEGSTYRMLVQIKLDALGGTPAPSTK